MTCEEALAAALALPPVERAELVERILVSFEFPAPSGEDASWAREAEDRVAAYERGEMKAVPAEAVFRRLGRSVER